MLLVERQESLKGHLDNILATSPVESGSSRRKFLTARSKPIPITFAGPYGPGFHIPEVPPLNVTVHTQNVSTAWTAVLDTVVAIVPWNVSTGRSNSGRAPCIRLRVSSSR